MGRLFWFECSRCGYRATVSGGADRGLNFFTQTVACFDCKRLYDVVTRLRVPQELLADSKLKRLGKPPRLPGASGPPSFEVAASMLPYRGVRHLAWNRYKPQCPVSSAHRLSLWTDPGKCPKCGLHLEKTVLPYRLWE